MDKYMSKTHHTPHSHLKRLTPSPKQDPSAPSTEVLFQPDASQAFDTFSNLIQTRSSSGIMLYLTGPTSSSKSALTHALSSSLGDRYPFLNVSASEMTYSFLTNIIRKAIGLRLREIKEIYEGEVLSAGLSNPTVKIQNNNIINQDYLPLNRTPNSISSSNNNLNSENNNNDKILQKQNLETSTFNITLRSALGVKKISLDSFSAVQFSNQNIKPGDVIIIEVNSGTIQRLGRCDVYSTEFDLECERYVPLPKGEIYQRKVGVKDVTMFDIDKANKEYSTDFESSLGKNLETIDTAGICDSLKEEINKTIRFYEMRGNAQIYPGVICIRDAHLLDRKFVSIISGMNESVNWMPNWIFVSSRPFNEEWARWERKFLFLETKENSVEEIKRICSNRILYEGESLEKEDDKMIDELAKASGNANYCLQMFRLAKSGASKEDLENVLSGREFVRRLGK